jgi:hypothetical protein
VGTLVGWRTTGGGPEYIQLKGRGRYGRLVRYDPEDLKAWMQRQRRVKSTTDAAMER